MDLDSWTVYRVLFLEEVCRLFSIYEGIDDLVGVGGKTIPGGLCLSCPKGYAVWEGIFGMVIFDKVIFVGRS